MEIKILGPGCYKCDALEKHVKEVVGELQLDATIDHVKDMKQILEYPILRTPGLVINGEVVSAGQVPSKAEVTKLIVNALEKEEKA